MKERPILMATESVKAILEGRKTQTRRVIKPCSTATLHDGSQPDWVFTLAKCPYGKVGDRLWVRETWKAGLREDGTYLTEYKASGFKLGVCEPVAHCFAHYESKWQPSIHMFRGASRITLEITEVRVERLQEISAGDCTKEGIPYEDGDYVTMKVFDKFRLLWDSLNAKRGYGWEVNPWVWVIGFSLCQRL